MPAHKGIIDTLKKVDIFQTLGDAALALIGENLQKRILDSGEIICREGEPGGSLYVVESGEISVLKTGKDDLPVEITTLHSGEVGGIMSLFGDEKRSATMRASGRVVLWEMRDAEFHVLLDKHPAIARGLLSVLSRYLRENIRVVADLRSRDADSRLKIAFFDSKSYTQKAFLLENRERFSLKFFEFRLTADTIAVIAGFKVICCFVNDDLSAGVVSALAQAGVELVAMRAAGYNNVDLSACRAHAIDVVAVPAYSPHAIAEHAVALMLALNRHVARAFARVRDGNFALDGLVGFDMFGKKVGVVGAGRIGQCMIDIMCGLGCEVLVHDTKPRTDARPNVRYVGLDELFRASDIISLHAPLVPETRHLINEKTIAVMKPGVMLINTSRGGLVDTAALLKGLLNGVIGYAGLDVYEEEGGYFFEDHSGEVLADEALARLTTFPNVIVTPHMAFLTDEALRNIAHVTLDNIRAYEEGKRGADLPNSLIR